MPISGSLAGGTTDMLSAMVEAVRPNIVEIYAQVRNLSKKVGPARRVTNVNDKLYRIPLRNHQGMGHAIVNMDGGQMAYGAAQSLTHLTGGFVAMQHTITVTQAALDRTANRPTSNGDQFGGGSVDALQDQFQRGLENIAILEDICLFNNGDGILTAGASSTSTSGSATTYVFQAAGDYRGVRQIVEGLPVNVYDSGLTVNRANATRAGYPSQIQTVDYGAATITLSNAVTGAAAGDVLVIAGISAVGGAATPAPAWGQSGWPLAGDTARHGIPYYNAIDTAKYVLGRLRSTMPQLNPSTFAVNGTLTPFHTLAVTDQIRVRRGDDVANQIRGIAPLAQRTQMISIGTAITEIMTSPGMAQRTTDLMPANTSVEQTIMFGGVEHDLSTRQPNDRVDYTIWNNWERVEVFPGIRPTPNPGGQDGVFQEFSTTGQPVYARSMRWDSCYDFANVDPGAGGVLTGLTPYGGTQFYR